MKRVSPNNIQNLEPNEIFVFGSNESGIHGAGAAKLALDKFGAQFRNPEGLQGQSYAIPTKNRTVMMTLEIEEIKPYVDKFIKFSQENPQLKFLVTEIGCGLAGHTPESIAPLFKEAKAVKNIYLPKRFLDILI